MVNPVLKDFELGNTYTAQLMEHDAQKEIQMYAKAVLDLSNTVFPVALPELTKRAGADAGV